MINTLGHHSGHVILRKQAKPIKPLKISLSRAAKNGVYKIKTSTTSGFNDVYCQMTSLPGCFGGGGWTMVMKINGTKVCFREVLVLSLITWSVATHRHLLREKIVFRISPRHLPQVCSSCAHAALIMLSVSENFFFFFR